MILSRIYSSDPLRQLRMTAVNDVRPREKTSRFVGVSWDPRRKAWRATISVNGCRKHLGYFAYEEAAAETYRAAADKRDVNRPQLDIRRSHGFDLDAWEIVGPKGSERLSRQQYLIAALLHEHAGRVVSHRLLIDFLWGKDPNGGPEAPQKSINVQVCMIRRAIRKTGAPVKIESFPAGGYAWAGVGVSQPARVSA